MRKHTNECVRPQTLLATVAFVPASHHRDWTSTPEEPRVVHTDDALPRLPEVRARAFLGLLRAGHHLDQQLDAGLRHAHGLGLRSFEVLLHLAVFSPDRRLPMTQLSEQTPLSQSRTSRLVAELEAQGFVTRQKAANDSRSVDVSLTERGLDVFVAAQESHLRDLDTHFFSRLSWAQVAQLATITDAILEPVNHDTQDEDTEGATG